MPNLFAYGMILLWPIIAIALYKKFDTVTATFWVIVGGYMLLPVKTFIDLPAIPSIGKDQISAISALIGCLFIKKEKIYFLGKETYQKVMISLLIIIPLINVFFNSEPMFNGKLWLQGLTIYDSVGQTLMIYLSIIPFVIGLSVIKSIEDGEKIFKLLVIAGLIYSPLIILEVLLSPQLHTWLYGFFPHSFIQQVRFDGFRAAAFMGHGLLVAVFYFVCCLAAAFEFKQTSLKSKKLKSLVIFIYMFFILMLSKSVGAIFLGVVFITVLFSLPWNIKVTFLRSVVILFLLYPTLSLLGLIPYTDIIAFIQGFSIDKAGSLDFRFNNEQILLTHAAEKFFIGWGSWGRNQLFDSITDGYWLIVYGQYGSIYFYTFFLLFSMPIINSFKKPPEENNKLIVFACCAVIGGVLIDQIPNSSLDHSWLWFICGAFTVLTKLSQKVNKNA